MAGRAPELYFLAVTFPKSEGTNGVSVRKAQWLALPQPLLLSKDLLDLSLEARGLGHFIPVTQVLLSKSPRLLVSATNH